MYTAEAVYTGNGRKSKKREHKRIRLAAVVIMEIWILLFLLWQAAGSVNEKLPELVQAKITELAAEIHSGIAERLPAQAPVRGYQEIKSTLHSGRKSSNVVLPDMMELTPAAPVVAIDAGHGGEDEGCHAGDILEKDINLQIAQQVSARLTEMGYQVLMIREGDAYKAKEDRVELANRMGVDIYVSIHQNTFEETQAKGIETWYYGEDESRDSKRLAQLIHQGVTGKTGAQEREVRDDANFCVTGRTEMPACLVETGFLSNPEERALLVTPEYQALLADGIAEGIRLYFEPKTMYLTFDDGPTAENTVRVLDVLKERGIRATFFVVGENVEKNPEVAKRIVEEGHVIGIHCYSHDYGKIYESVESYLEDFEKAYQVVYEVTGVKPQLFRFPGGSINSYNQEIYGEIIDKMTEKGFIYYDWNASLEDAVKKSEPEQLIANAKETTLGRNKVVLLAHDAVYNTGICLDELLDELPEYQFLPLDAETTPIQFPRG